MKTAIFLRAALGTCKDVEQTLQYADGIYIFFKFFQKSICYVDGQSIIPIYLVDNTITELSSIFNKVIPRYVKKLLFIQNDYGIKNKGAGLIEAWLRTQEHILKYDYILHFELRQELISFDFIESFLSTPRNLLTINKEANHFNTGLFGVKSSVLIDFITSTSLQEMADKKLSIEDLLYKYFYDNRKLNYDALEKMNVIRREGDKQYLL